MQDDEINTETAYLNNLATSSALLTLGGEVLERVLGNESTSTQINEETQTRKDLQELLASRIQRRLGL